GTNAIGMPLEHALRLPGAGLPESDDVVGAGGGERLAVRGKGDGGDPAIVLEDGGRLLSRRKLRRQQYHSGHDRLPHDLLLIPARVDPVWGCGGTFVTCQSFPRHVTNVPPQDRISSTGP